MEEKVCPQGAEQELTAAELGVEGEERAGEEQGLSRGETQAQGGEGSPTQPEGLVETGEEKGTEGDKKEDELARLKQALEEQQAEKEEYLRLLQRTRADFDNYRRRIERERRDFINRANERLFLELLPVLDNLERALQIEGEASAAAIREGVELIYRQFLAVLMKEGVTPIEARGKPFDPELHEAVLQVEDPAVEAGTVVEEVQKGYMLHGRVLRPSMVKVAKG
ncbi:MAG TPA: nucleotide exchange factor GrpE [Firmicutes bacterium]|nr:nucleotide exchange factor GrpE [Bacillota bacterium]